MKNHKRYTPSQYKTFAIIKNLLLSEAEGMRIIVDEPESFYLSFPVDSDFGEKAGTLFGAILIADASVDLYLPALMNNPELLQHSSLSCLSGYRDAKGIFHFFLIDAAMDNALKDLFLILNEHKFAPGFKEVQMGGRP